MTRTTLLLALSLAACATSTEPAADPAPAPVEPAPAPAAAARLDLNTATAEQLATIPGMSPKMVHEFEEYRPYVSISQFRKEIGKYVDAAQVAAYEPYVYVPVDPAASDAATLQQLPGVDATEAEALVAGRPYADRAAFLTALASFATPEEIEAGTALLVP